MLLLVAGQGYWLWNQYQYKNEEYEEEIHRLGHGCRGSERLYPA